MNEKDLTNLVLGIHLAVEKYKDDGLTPEQAVSVSVAPIQRIADEVHSDIYMLDDLEVIKQVDSQLDSVIEETKSSLQNVSVIIKTNPLGVCEKVGLDVEYALSYITNLSVASFEIQSLCKDVIARRVELLSKGDTTPPLFS